MKQVSTLPTTVDELKQLVGNSNFYVEFVKANGEIRPMNATFNLSNVLEEHQPKGNGTRKPSQEIAVVYDLEKKEWRSFSLKNLKVLKTN